LRNEIPDGQAIDPVFSYIVEIIKNSHQINNQASYIASLKYFLKEHLQGAKAVVLVPDGTPAAMLAATIAHQQEVQTYTMLAAGISEEFSTFIYCVAQNIFVYGEQPKKVLEAVMHNKRFLYSGNTKMYCYTKFNLSKNHAYTILIATSRY